MHEKNWNTKLSYMKSKKIYLNTRKTKYCVVELYKTKKEMREAYKKRCPHDTHHDIVLGAHQAYEKFIMPKKFKKDHADNPKKFYRLNTSKLKLAPETGTIFLSLEDCGAGVVTHEIMHATLWAYKHKKMKQQYPIKIKDMKEEELVLRNFTLAVQQFYRWYWKIKDRVV